MTVPREWVVPYKGHDLHLTLAEYRTLRAVGWASSGRADLLAQQFLTRETQQIEAL